MQPCPGGRQGMRLGLTWRQVISNAGVPPALYHCGGQGLVAQGRGGKAIAAAGRTRGRVRGRGWGARGLRGKGGEGPCQWEGQTMMSGMNCAAKESSLPVVHGSTGRQAGGAPDGVVQVGGQVLQQLDGAERGDGAAQAVACTQKTAVAW